MAAEKLIKIYDISTLGADVALKDLDKINKKFVELKKNKITLTATRSQIEDPAELKRVNKELTDLTIKEKQLVTELKKKQVALKEYQLIAAQDREAKKKEVAANQALEGSYNQIAAKYKELLNISKNTTNLFNAEEVKQAQIELKKYKDILDQYNRGLSKDGTLVGEYTTGILNAFKNSGLDNLIKEQLIQAKQNVKDLDNEFASLKKELEEVRKSGKGSLDVIQRALIENRQQAQSFEQQINRVENEMRTLGSTGNPVINAIGLQFKNLKKDVAGFVLGFIGIQAALSRVTGEFNGALEDAKQFDGVQQAFERLNRPDLLDNLRKATKGTVKDLELMKAAVNADNLGIDIKQIGTYFEFAKQRAQDTGESVDYLVESIIKGIGRKSPLILDNLGISAFELKKEMKGVSLETAEVGTVAAAVGRIIQRENAKTKDSQEKASAELERNKVKWENLRSEFGTKILPVVIKISSALVGLAGAMAAIDFGFIATGIALVTGALALYKAEQIRATIATSLATKEGILYRTWTIAQTVATNAQRIAIKYATREIILFNGALRVTPLGIFLTTLLLVVTGLKAFAGQSNTVVNKLDNWAQRMKFLSEAYTRAQKEIQGTINKSRAYLEVAKDHNLSDAQRQKALDGLIRLSGGYLKALTLQNLETKKGTDLINDYTNKLKEQALTEAKIFIARREFDKIKDLQIKQFDLNEKFRTAVQNKRKLNFTELDEETTKIALGNQNNILTRNFGEVSASNIKQVNEYFNKAIAEQEARAKAAIQNTGKEISDIFEQTTGVQPAPATVQKDKKDKKEINRIEELKKQYQKEKEIQETQLTDKKITEAEYYKALEELTDKYRFNKLKAIHKLNKDEKDTQASFNNELSKDKVEALQKSFDIEVNLASKQYEIKSQQIKQEQQRVEDDLSLSHIQRIDKQIETDKKLLGLQMSYNAQLDELEKKYALQSEDNADARAEALLEIQTRLNKDIIQKQLAGYDALQDAQKEDLRKVQSKYYDEIIKVLQSSGNTKKKQELVRKIEEQSKKELTGIRLKQIDIELNENQKLLEQKLINQQTFNDRFAELEQERINLIRDINDQELNIEKDKTEIKNKIQEASFQILGNFINTYIQRQQEEVDFFYRMTQEKLQIQKKARLEQAQSQAEQDSINREYEEKEKEAERKRNKDRQSILRQQLAMEFALASIKALSTSTTIVDGLIKESIVTAEYFAALALLNKQQFAFSGKVRPERLTDGIINAAPNVAPTPHGDNVLAYVKPNEVILNERHQQMLGGDRTFAAIGVPGFYGASLKPPVLNTHTTNSTDVEELKVLINQLASMVIHEHSKPIVLNPHHVTQFQNKYIRDVNLATI